MDDPPCPHCGHGRPYRITSRNRFKCRQCHRQYSEKSAGGFHSSKLSLEAISSITRHMEERPSDTIANIARSHGLSYRGAYYIVARIRRNGR